MTKVRKCRSCGCEIAGHRKVSLIQAISHLSSFSLSCLCVRISGVFQDAETLSIHQNSTFNLTIVLSFGFRAEKSEVLSEDLLVLDKRVELIRQVCHNTQKTLSACVQGKGTDVEKRLVSTLSFRVILFSFEQEKAQVEVWIHSHVLAFGSENNLRITKNVAAWCRFRNTFRKHCVCKNRKRTYCCL